MKATKIQKDRNEAFLLKQRSLKDDCNPENYIGSVNSLSPVSETDRTEEKVKEVVNDLQMDIIMGLKLLAEASSPEQELENEKVNEGDDQFDDDLDKRYNWNRMAKENI